MNIQSATYSGLQGLQRASAGVTEATLDINRQTKASAQARQETAQQETARQNTVQQNEAQQATSAADNSTQNRTEQPALTDSLVRLNSEERNAQANVKSIQTADQVLGSVIDIRV